MYEERFPEVDQVVMVQVKNVAEMGAYVSLLEYNNIEGELLIGMQSLVKSLWIGFGIWCLATRFALGLFERQ